MTQSLKKKGEGQYSSTFETLLGFDFDGTQKTMWLEEKKRAKLLTMLKGGIRSGEHKSGVAFKEFESITQNYSMLSLPYKVERDCSHHATDSCKNTQTSYTS